MHGFLIQLNVPLLGRSGGYEERKLKVANLIFKNIMTTAFHLMSSIDPVFLLLLQN